MNRDMELVRQILIQVEENLQFDSYFLPEIDGYSKNEIFYHIKLMYEAGLVEAQSRLNDDNACWVVKSLTFSGHDFLDAARSDTLWARAKSIVAKSGGALTLEALKIALSMAVTSALSSGG